jgi:hypothetical protein
MLSRITTIFLIVFYFLNANEVSARDIIKKDKLNSAPLKEREAILILSGLGSVLHSTKDQRQSFTDKGYDVFIPDYLSRRSLDGCVSKLQRFAQENQLSSYKKVHILCYIVGSWTFNRWYEQNPLANIVSVVYDRSPLQETLPPILCDEDPLFSKLLFGELIFDLANTSYKPLFNNQLNFGILIECKATKYLWHKYDAFGKLSPRTFDPEQFGQRFNDYCYFFLSHDDMYTKIHEAAPSILNFFSTGSFGETDRSPCAKDPFQTYRKNK